MWVYYELNFEGYDESGDEPELSMDEYIMATKGDEIEWFMYEYEMATDDGDDWVICVLYKKVDEGEETNNDDNLIEEENSTEIEGDSPANSLQHLGYNKSL